MDQTNTRIIANRINKIVNNNASKEESLNSILDAIAILRKKYNGGINEQNK